MLTSRFVVRVVVLVVGASLLPSFTMAQPTQRRIETVPAKGPLAGQTAYTNSYALLVGINEYKSLPKENWLDFAKTDALALRETLVRSYGFPSENIITLVDEQATRDNIRTALTYLTDKKTVLPSDRILIYFSCHGQAIQTPDGGKEGFLIPYDAQIDLKDPTKRAPYYQTAMPMRHLWAYLESCPARHCLVIADTCFGGLLARAKRAPLGKQTLKTLLSKTAYEVLSAGGQNESAWEDPALGHSVLMHCLLKELQSRVADADGTFSLMDMFVSVRDMVIEKSKCKQTPKLESYGGTEGDLVFVATAARPVPPLVTGLPTAESHQLVEIYTHVRASELVTAAHGEYIGGEYRGAEQLYKQAIELDRDSSQAHCGLAIINHAVKKNYAEAERQYNKAIELDPDDASAYTLLGALHHVVKKDYREAERLYDKAIDLDPKAALAYNNLGVLNSKVKRDYAEAERLYEKALEFNPTDASFSNLAILVEQVKGDSLRAKELYKRAIDLDPNADHDPDDLRIQTKTLYVEPEPVNQMAINLDPMHARAYACFAFCLLRDGDRRKAVALANKAKRLGLRDHFVYALLGIAPIKVPSEDGSEDDR